MEIRADETGAESICKTTLLVGTATGTADTSAFRCGLVRRIADKTAHRELDAGLADALREIERRGTEWYLGAAAIGPVLDAVRNAIDFGRGD
jgi:hypothetical protein